MVGDVFCKYRITEGRLAADSHGVGFGKFDFLNTFVLSCFLIEFSLEF